MLLYVIRHGTTDNNINCLVNGRNDIDINELGIKDAGRASFILKDIQFDRIYCSPLLRAKHTMQIVNCNNFLVTYDERLIERDAGIMTNKPESEIDLNIWYRLDEKNIYGGSETFSDVFRRVSLFLDEIKEKHKNDTILLVTHDGVLKAIDVYYFGYPGLDAIKNWDNPNCGIRKYKL